ncbi:uncharacterized protein DFL_000572 [Arthrobotrys flagrans]|uniref:Uncharacterized protein n=1 Tax=Arthrobotrys flagrans TaxID=97331 RepID=A0A437AE49_ARTFL|nr:hypothetical protein DFL_000572 [Arthrobotrys flagrans]
MKSTLISIATLYLLSTLPGLVLVDGNPNTVISIALRSTTGGINTGYNAHPPPAIAFSLSPNPTGAGPHCIDPQLVMIGRYYNIENSQEIFFGPLGQITHFKVVDGEESHAWRMWDENVRGEGGERIGAVVWADGNRWRTSYGNNMMVRVLEFDWQPTIKAADELNAADVLADDELEPGTGWNLPEIEIGPPEGDNNNPREGMTPPGPSAPVIVQHPNRALQLQQQQPSLGIPAMFLRQVPPNPSTEVENAGEDQAGDKLEEPPKPQRSDPSGPNSAFG